MLGMMSSMTEVGYYENSNKLTQTPGNGNFIFRNSYVTQNF